MSYKIGFIGAGQMARAMAAGFVRAGLVEPEQVWAADPNEAARDEFARAVAGANVGAENGEVAEAANVLVLAVKPHFMPAVLAELEPNVNKRHLVVSIAAGIPTEKLAEGLGRGVRIVRVMPNTPCLIGRSASGYCRGPGATEDDMRRVSELLGSIGRAFELDEKLMDAVTGLAGSGPAFVYVVVEALADGGVRMGLPRAVAAELAAQTVAGAAQMVLETGQHPATLKDAVASPGGTTIAGLEALEAAGLRSALIAAVGAATRRSAELGAAELGA